MDLPDMNKFWKDEETFGHGLLYSRLYHNIIH